MKIMIETAEELFRFAEKNRDEEDHTPYLPGTAQLEICNVVLSCVGTEPTLTGAEGFTLGPELTTAEIIIEALQRLNISAVVK